VSNRVATQGVIVADIDRLSRLSLIDALELIERVEGAGGQVISVAQNFDAATPRAAGAATSGSPPPTCSSSGTARTSAARRSSAVERGVWPLPKAPIGYTVHHRKHGGDGKLRIDPTRRPRVKRAFELRAGGAPWSKVAEQLTGGISAAGKVVRNRVYLGEINYAGASNPAAHEPIVDRALWEAAQIAHPGRRAASTRPRCSPGSSGAPTASGR
jgi:site-specific DNA recombinase